MWRSNFIPLVHDSIIIIGSRSVTYTFGSHFACKRWVRVFYQNLNFSFLGQVFQYFCWVSKRVYWGSHQATSPDDSSPVLSSAYDPPVLDPVAPPSPESSVGPELRCSTQVSIPPPYLTDYHCSFALATLYEPHTYREAHTDPLWQQAMNEELNALHKNNTWDMVDLPPGQSVVGCRWVYKIKTKANGSIERYKARLVAKGFT